jgi:hypothetical protein
MPAAAPEIRKVFSSCGVGLNLFAMREPIPPPSRRLGPSNPALPPVPIVIADAIGSIIVSVRDILPPW